MTNSGEEDEEESCNTCQFMELIDKYTLGLFRKVAEGSFKGKEQLGLPTGTTHLVVKLET
jgi:hypothetical protein